MGYRIFTIDSEREVRLRVVLRFVDLFGFEERVERRVKVRVKRKEMERERKKVIRVVYRRVKEVKRKKELEVIGLYKYDDLWVGECFEEKGNFFFKELVERLIKEIDDNDDVDNDLYFCRKRMRRIWSLILMEKRNRLNYFFYL